MIRGKRIQRSRRVQLDNHTITPMADTSRLRHRRVSSHRDPSPIIDDDIQPPQDPVRSPPLYLLTAPLIVTHQNSRTPLEYLLESHEASMLIVGVLTVLSFALRFYKINHPDQVVFVRFPSVDPSPQPHHLTS